METKREVFEEAVQAIFPMFTKVGTEHHGKYFDIPLRNVVPKPVQKELPIWIGGSSEAAIRRTAKFGTGWQAAGETPALPDKGPTTRNKDKAASERVDGGFGHGHGGNG